MQRSNPSVSSSLSSLPMDNGMEYKQPVHQPDQLFPQSLYHESSSPFGSAHETTLSSLSEPVVFRGIHTSYQLGDNNSNGYGHGGNGTYNGDSLFDQSSLWPSQSSASYGDNSNNSYGNKELSSLSLSAVPLKSQSSFHRAHEPSMDDSLDGLISSSSLWEQPTEPLPAFGTAKDLFVTVTPLAAHVSVAPMDDCPPLPIYVERYNSFTVSRRAVFEDIIAHLVAIGVDHSVHDHKIRGLVYPSGQRTGSCEFHINRYKCDTANEWMIEVQRRAGCMFAFNQLYRSIVAATSSYHIINTNEPLLSSTPSIVPSSSSSSAVPAASSNSDMLPTVEPLTVKQLTTMASSSAVEVARAGMESLATLSSISPACATACVMAIRAATLPLLSLASTMVATASPATARAAADLVANICTSSHDGVALALSTPLVTSLLNMLDAPSSLSLRDTKRHCSRALAAMATSDIAGLRSCVASYDALPTSAFTAVAILERYTATDDLPLRTSIDNTLIALRSA